MLFRCCAICCVIILTSSDSFCENKLDIYQKQGKESGHMFKNFEFSPENINAITPNELKGKKFDRDTAYKQINNVSHTNSDKYPKNELDPTIISVLENAENSVVPVSPLNDTTKETIEKCTIENHYEIMNLHHFLNVEVIHKPKITKTVQICKGHKSEEKSDSPESDKRQKRKSFSNNPNIKTFSVNVKNKGLGHRDIIASKWTHTDNATCCDSFYEKEIEISPEVWTENDYWNIENPELINSLNCTLINTSTGNSETHLINGKEVLRPFWSKIQTLQCVKKNSNSCEFLKEKNCILTFETCIKQINGKCVILEQTYKCQTRKEHSLPNLKGIYGTNSTLWETEYLPNKDMSDVTTKLAVFDEMKKELQNSQSTDIREVHIFKGNIEQCSKSIADDLMYDCCFDMDGLTNKLKLSKCTSDEIALVESRRKGLTHYIGEKKAEFLGLWTSRKEHVFCVFPSKLSRVFQEEARKQLKLDWGTSEKPDCRGLTQQEIKQLNFTKLDLTEAFELPKTPDHTERVQKIEEKLKQRIEAM